MTSGNINPVEERGYFAHDQIEKRKNSILQYSQIVLNQIKIKATEMKIFRLKHCIFVTQVFSNIGLVKDTNGSRIQLATICCAFCSHSKALRLKKSRYNRNIGHGINNNSLMFWSIFSDPSQMSLQNMIPIHKTHLSSRLYPNFVLI